jgi:hypothetical protein
MIRLPERLVDRRVLDAFSARKERFIERFIALGE